jgi:hypothetical protein
MLSIDYLPTTNIINPSMIKDWMRGYQEDWHTQLIEQDTQKLSAVN